MSTPSTDRAIVGVFLDVLGYVFFYGFVHGVYRAYLMVPLPDVMLRLSDFFLVFPGVFQAIWVVPLATWAIATRRPHTLLGLIVSAAVTFLLGWFWTFSMLQLKPD